MLQPLEEYMAKVMQLVGGWYWSGCWGSVGTETLWNQKRVQTGLVSWYTQYASAKSKGIGKKVLDCTGVYKFPLWQKPDGSVPHTKETDMNESDLFALAKSKGLKWGTITTIPRERKGILVTFTGHMGCYLGNGTVLEARGGAYGVVTTQLDSRGWQYWYENPFVDYTQKGDNMKKGDINENVKLWQEFLNSKGAVLQTDGDWGNLTETATVKFLSNNGILYTSIVDIGILLVCLRLDVKDETSVTEINRLIGIIKQRDEALTTLNNTIASANSNVIRLNSEVANLKTAYSLAVPSLETIEWVKRTFK